MTSMSQQTPATDRISLSPFKNIHPSGVGYRLICIDRYGFTYVYAIMSIIAYEEGKTTDYIKMLVRLMEPYFGGQDILMECLFDSYGWHYDIEVIHCAL